MKNLFISLLFIIAATTAFTDPIEPYITVESEKQLNRGIALKVTEIADVYPFFGAGIVMNTSDDKDDSRNYGRYIETFTEVSYEVEGEKLTDLIFIVYSNLNTINVKKGDQINIKTLLGTAFGEGTPIYPDSSDFFVYLYTMDLSPYLLKMTNGRFINSEDAIWWDPSFLIKKD